MSFAWAAVMSVVMIHLATLVYYTRTIINYLTLIEQELRKARQGK